MNSNFDWKNNKKNTAQLPCFLFQFTNKFNQSFFDKFAVSLPLERRYTSIVCWVRLCGFVIPKPLT